MFGKQKRINELETELELTKKKLKAVTTRKRNCKHDWREYDVESENCPARGVEVTYHYICTKCGKTKFNRI